MKDTESAAPPEAMLSITLIIHSRALDPRVPFYFSLVVHKYINFVQKKEKERSHFFGQPFSVLIAP